MRALVIIDTLDGLKPYKDTSLDLVRTGIARGHALALCRFDDLMIVDGVLRASVQEVAWDDAGSADTKDFFDSATIAAAATVDVDSFDVVVIRKDPPFDAEYHSLTLLLDLVGAGTLVVNSPAGLRNVSEKLSAQHFAKHAPRTLIAYAKEAVRDFAAGFDRVVLKASYFGSGSAVFISSAGAPDFDDVLDRILALEPRGPIIAQEFLPEVKDGDARVMMIDGVPIAALGRKPPEGEFRANIAVGGTEFAVEITPAQRAAAEEIGGFLRAQGILFAGLDFIGDRLIEMNVTSPTLVQELRRVGGPDVSALLWEAMEARSAR